MRTTLTLDDDVAASLQRLQRQSRRPWKSVVNDALRAGMTALEAEPRKRARVVRTKSVRLGMPRLVDVSNVHEALSLAEGDRHS